MRTCIVCGCKADKYSLLRLVRINGLSPDPLQTMPSRGAYLCRSRNCIGGLKIKLFRRVFRTCNIDKREVELLQVILENGGIGEI